MKSPRKSLTTQVREFFGMSVRETAENLAKLDTDARAELAMMLDSVGYPVDPRSLTRTPRVTSEAQG